MSIGRGTAFYFFEFCFLFSIIFVFGNYKSKAIIDFKAIVKFIIFKNFYNKKFVFKK